MHVAEETLEGEREPRDSFVGGQTSQVVPTRLAGYGALLALALGNSPVSLREIPEQAEPRARSASKNRPSRKVPADASLLEVLLLCSARKEEQAGAELSQALRGAARGRGEEEEACHPERQEKGDRDADSLERVRHPWRQEEGQSSLGG